ncbi:ABC transporter permease [Halobacillus litoralis]|uniref:ABC transporter permease n=1 Tax=Halobacillus litoralis TaxID=45668 RepID=UPI001CD2FC61|nr:ABC transporter permease [Halobacillus litoralis]MCA0972115.1 ABC transporter permease [Halobacillus litoralis]
MTLNQLIWKSFKKNIGHYSLYIFALIFSVSLYFAFVTMSASPDTSSAQQTTTGSVGIRLASIVLIAIVAVFLLYANRIFIKRRSREIGLYQLIGMTKNQVFRVLSIEHFLLYFSSLAVGVFIGFAGSKFLELILLNITGQTAVASLVFSTEALVQTLILFTIIYALIMVSNALFIRKKSILDLFNVRATREGKRQSVVEVIIGVLGILLIGTGYYVSSVLFDGDIVRVELIFGAMLFILFTVILGTYLFYKGSVSFIGHLIRKKKGGYLNVTEVISLSSILFRMKSNSLMLTVITTVSALAIGLLSLSYITYYSAEETAKDIVAGDFAFMDPDGSEAFIQKLEQNGIDFEANEIEIVRSNLNVKELVQADLDSFNFDASEMIVAVIGDEDVPNLNVEKDEVVFSGRNDLMEKVVSLEDTGTVLFEGVGEKQLTATKDEYYISYFFSSGGLPAAVVDSETFTQIQEARDPELQFGSNVQVTVNIDGNGQLEEANKLFNEMESGELPQYSRLNMTTDQKQSIGLSLFIIGFLGLTFLITSGCILYFKQVDESEEERANYTILRKLGFTRTDLLRGIIQKQLFNFGIPLAIGLLHSYFAVQSGWFIFGSELWAPMFIVMGIYASLYSIFGLLSIQHYRKVIRTSLR